MTLPYAIAASQVDAKSPVDDNLMGSIKLNLEYLDQLLTQGGAPVYTWSINGDLSQLTFGRAKRIDMQFLHVLQQFTNVRVAQNESGTSGVTEIDIRYHSKPKTPITGVTPKLSMATNSVSQIIHNLATQSIARATDPVATQSITRAKSTLNIQSVIALGVNIWRYNTDVALDADYGVTDSILVAGCVAGGNNGTFTIVEVNPSGAPGFTVTNASGVAQSAPAGTADLQCFKYNLIDPASDQFVAGEYFLPSGHTSGVNSGTFSIFKINSGGNNIWVKNAVGVTQGGIAGTINTARWKYSYAAPVPADFVVGEWVQFTGHSSGVNNNTLEILGVNVGGNNIIVNYWPSVAQGSAAGVANTKRWKYTFSSNPVANVLVGESVIMSSHSSAGNNGTFTVVQINNNTSDNIVVHNVNGVAQAGVAGTVNHTHKLVKFATDQSLIYAVGAYVELEEMPNSVYNAEPYLAPYKILEVNRGGGANYNIVIDEPLTDFTQNSPAGYVAVEAKSIFNLADGSKPQVSSDLLGNAPNGLLKATYGSANFVATPVPDNSYLGLYILQVQAGNPRDLSVMLT